MKHISNSNDWFYEFRPHIMIGFGVFGLLSRFLTGAPTDWSLLNFLCSVVLFASAAHIISMRKDYRKTNVWMK